MGAHWGFSLLVSSFGFNLLPKLRLLENAPRNLTAWAMLERYGWRVPGRHLWGAGSVVFMDPMVVGTVGTHKVPLVLIGVWSLDLVFLGGLTFNNGGHGWVLGSYYS